MKKATKDTVYIIVSLILIGIFICTMPTLIQAIKTIDGFVFNILSLLSLMLIYLTWEEK